MPARQPQALTSNPNDDNLARVAVYDRLIHASIERVWENVLDWEHLPSLHETSFDFCELDEAGDWGWRTWSDPDHRNSIELCVDLPASRYVARSYQADQQVSEIWTTLTPEGADTRIRVSFDHHNVDPAQTAKLGGVYLKLYEQLWNEDEAMMQLRTIRLARPDNGLREVRLEKAGFENTIVELGRGIWHVQQSANGLLINTAICPHLLGPLPPADNHGITRCPWHGYEFDVASGRCINSESATCKLPRTPVVAEDNTTYILRM